MTKSETAAIKARANELIEMGIDKDLAKVMAKAEFDCKLIGPVIEDDEIVTFKY